MHIIEEVDVFPLMISILNEGHSQAPKDAFVILCWYVAVVGVMHITLIYRNFSTIELIQTKLPTFIFTDRDKYSFAYGKYGKTIQNHQNKKQLTWLPHWLHWLLGMFSHQQVNAYSMKWHRDTLW